MSGKTKEELINHPSIYSSINMVDQARKHPLERLLIQMNQDPDHSALCLVLLNIAYSAPNITAVAADAIHSVAILIDTLPAHFLAPDVSQQPLILPQLGTIAADLEAQVTSLMTCVANIHETTEVNKTAAETLTRTIDEARNDLHNAAQVVNELVEELLGVPTQIKDTTPINPPPSPSSSSHPSRRS